MWACAYGNGQTSWKWPNKLERSKLEMVQVGNGPSWKWSKLEMAIVGNGCSWKWPKLEMAVSRNERPFQATVQKSPIQFLRFMRSTGTILS